MHGSAAAGIAAGLSLGAPASARVIGANDRISIGLIGCGQRASAHLRNNLPKMDDPKWNFRIAAVSDIYRPRLESAAAATGGKPFHDYRDLLAMKGLDAVLIATPDHWHAKMAIDAMNAGLDVYLEKPMTYTWQEARKVAAVCNKTKRIMQVGVQSTSDDTWWKARDLIKAGAIGKVLWSQSSYSRNSREGEWNYSLKEASPDVLDWQAFLGSAPKRPFDPARFFQWRKYWDYSGGIATDLFYHQLGHLQIALGPEFPTHVTSAGGIYVQKDGREVPDTLQMLIEYPSQHTICLHSSMASNIGVPEIVRGHEATMTFEAPGVVCRPQPQFVAERPEKKVALEPRSNHMLNWLECLRSRQKPHCDHETGYRVMVAIALGVAAYRKRKVMSFDPIKEELI